MRAARTGGVGDVAEDRCHERLIGPILFGELSKGLARDPACREMIGCVKRRAGIGWFTASTGMPAALSWRADFGIGSASELYSINKSTLRETASAALASAFSASPPLS